MKNFPSFPLLVYLLALNSNLNTQIIGAATANIRAISIGISDYENDKIPDLKYADQGKYKEALGHFEEAIKIQGRTYEIMHSDPILAPLRNMSAYKDLMNLYFPEKKSE